MPKQLANPEALRAAVIAALDIRESVWWTSRLLDIARDFDRPGPSFAGLELEALTRLDIDISGPGRTLCGATGVLHAARYAFWYATALDAGGKGMTPEQRAEGETALARHMEAIATMCRAIGNGFRIKISTRQWESECRKQIQLSNHGELVTILRNPNGFSQELS